MSEKKRSDFENDKTPDQSDKSLNTKKEHSQSDQEAENTNIKNAHAAGVGALGRSEDQIGYEKTPSKNSNLEGSDQY